MSYFTKLSQRLTGRSRGQSMVELALISPIVTVLMSIAFQLAIIGHASMALSQAASAAAHYAADHQSADQTAIATYVQSIASPTLKSNGGNDLSVVVTPSGVRTWGQAVSVSISYQLQSKVILPNPFLGVKIPASLTDSSTTFSE